MTIHTVVMMPAGRQQSVTLLLLLILIQMLTALIAYGGLFIVSTEASISPFQFSLLQQDANGPLCQPDSEPALGQAETNVNLILRTAAILGLYSPLALVAFALLAMLLAAYGEDQGALWCSFCCQAGSGLLTLMGLAAFVGRYWCHVSLTGMTVWFYVCLCLPAELAVTARLTMPVKKLMGADEKF